MNILKCKCCGEYVDIENQNLLKIDQKDLPWFAKELNLIDELKNIKNKIYWACDECMSNDKAIKPVPSLQRYCDYWPYLAYYDEKIKCIDCKKRFVFTKEEQKHWYEYLRFYVQSRPKCCKSCYEKRKNNK